MQKVDLVLVVAKFDIQSESHLLVGSREWNGWTFIGGYVEDNDWLSAAARKCNEEMAPLRHGLDFVLLPLLDCPIEWAGSVGGESTTQYRSQVFALRFVKPPPEFRTFFVREADFADHGDDPLFRALGGFERIPLAWWKTPES